MRLSENRKQEILQTLLERTSVKFFNECIKQFSANSLYYNEKKWLMWTFPELCSNLDFAIIMSDIMEPYRCDEIECHKNDRKITELYERYKLFGKYHPDAMKIIIEHDMLVIEQNRLLEPQNKLIALYKKVRRQMRNKIVAQ